MGLVEAKVVANVARELDQRGMLDCLRHGLTDRGVKLRLVFFKPASGLNPDTLRLYGQNILTVTRQVHFSEKQAKLSVDLLISVNGLPVVTAELKNPFTCQRVKNAIQQYQTDRDPREPLFQFKRRALVHFAVDPDEVFMTTKLEGKSTYFLPFNKGCGGGKGNPQNPHGYKTAYLWARRECRPNHRHAALHCSFAGDHDSLCAAGPKLLSAQRIGLMWLLLTVGFEFLFFHYIAGKPWEELLNDYNLAQGRLWVLVLLTLAIGPALIDAWLGEEHSAS